MAASFPASYDSLTNPSAGSLLTSPSHSAQHSDANDIVEAIEQRVGLSGSGLPGGPSSGQFFHHTTRRLDYFYNGTRWLTTHLYQSNLAVGDSLGPVSATANLSRAPVPPLSGGSDVWIEDAVAHFYVGVGTALGASHKWVGTLKKLADGGSGGSGTTIATFTVDSGASDAFRQSSQTVDALLNNGTTHVGLACDWTKTGTPGTLRAYVVITYRLVGLMVATYNDASDTYNDTDFLYDGLDPAETMSILIGTRTAAAVVVPKWDTFVATDNGSSGRGLVSMRIDEALSALPTVLDQAMIRVVDHSLNTETHRAFIRSRRPIASPRYDGVEIVADDIGGLVDDTFIALEVRPDGEDAQDRITGLWQAYADAALDDDLSAVAAIGSTLPAQTFSGVTLRQAIESTISLADTDADYYVDSLGKLHVFTSEVNNAPVNIDVDAPGGGEDAAEDLDIEYDSAAWANRVYVQGGTPEGSGYYISSAGITAASGVIRTTSLQAPDCTTADMAQALADMYLGRVASSIARGRFTITGVDGWRAGQNVLVTDSAKGLSAQSFRIRRVTTRVARPGATPVFRYDVEFGGSADGAQGPANGHNPTQAVYGNLGGDGRVFVTKDGITITDEGG